MPSPLTSALIGSGAVLTAVDATAGAIVAVVGLGVELFRFYISGNDGVG